MLDDSLIQEVSCVNEKGEPLAAASCNYSLNSFVKLGISASRIILGVVGALTLLMFVYGGIRMLISAGNAEAVTEGRKIIVGAIVGLAIVFLSYTIINFVINNVLQATINGNKAFNGSAPDDNPGAVAKDCSGVKKDGLSPTCSKITECSSPTGTPKKGTKECNKPDEICCIPAPLPAATCLNQNFTCKNATCEPDMVPASASLKCEIVGQVCCKSPNIEITEQ